MTNPSDFVPAGDNQPQVEPTECDQAQYSHGATTAAPHTDQQRQMPPPQAPPPGRPYQQQQPPAGPNHGRVPYPQRESVPASQQPQPPQPARLRAPVPSNNADTDRTEVAFFDAGHPPQPAPGAHAPAWGAPPQPHPIPSAGPAQPGAPSAAAGDYGPDDKEVLIGRRRRPTAPGGWRKAIAIMSGGYVNPGLSVKQEAHENLLDKIRSPLSGVYRVAFVSAKGGVGKTTLTVGVGGAIARERGDRVIAVDLNTALGDLSARFAEDGGHRANIEHLAAIPDSRSYGRYAMLREYTVQNRDRLEALSSQNNPASTYRLSVEDYAKTMEILDIHYNVVLLDCGTSIMAPLFSAIANDVTGLVVVAAQNTRGIQGAKDTLHWLDTHGFGQLLQRTVVVLNAVGRGRPLVNVNVVDGLFRQVVADVVQVPYDPQLAEGMEINYDALRQPTRQALLKVAGAVAEHYPVRHAARHRSDEVGGF